MELLEKIARKNSVSHRTILKLNTACVRFDDIVVRTPADRSCLSVAAG